MRANTTRMRIYVDVCTLCRPYDDQNLMRIRLETDAWYLILQHIQEERYFLIASPVHLREVEAIADGNHAVFIFTWPEKNRVSETASIMAISTR